jgi:hypothetical protein
MGAAYGYYNGRPFSGDYTGYLPSGFSRAINCSKAAAGLGALEWLLFVITLAVFCELHHPYLVSLTPPLKKRRFVWLDADVTYKSIVT